MKATVPSHAFLLAYGIVPKAYNITQTRDHVKSDEYHQTGDRR